MWKNSLSVLASLALAIQPLSPAFAQQAETAQPVSEAGPTDAEAQDEQALLTVEDLDALVAPVALYPDTLLIQILVAATYPIQVVQAQRFVDDNQDLEQDALTDLVETQGWDASVAVLATAFPTVLERMSDNISWTELAGSAMLAQSDDVMDAVQRQRKAAEDVGNLTDTPEQLVTRDETDSIVIMPADPEVIYVPTYDTTTVYTRNYDAAIFFTTTILIGAIFYRHNNWHSYWGCRNCAGWGHGPIYNRPVKINVNGDVNIGNNVGNSWKPEPGREAKARENISDRKANGGRPGAGKGPDGRPGTQPGTRPGTGPETRPGSGPDTMPNLRPEGSDRGDAMRRDLQDRTGAADISRPEQRPNAPGSATPAARPSTGGSAKPAARPATGGAAARPAKPSPAISQRPAAQPAAKPAAKPAARPAAKPRAAAKPAANHSTFQRNQGGGAARQSRSRGGASRGGGGGGRR